MLLLLREVNAHREVPLDFHYLPTGIALVTLHTYMYTHAMQQVLVSLITIQTTEDNRNFLTFLHKYFMGEKFLASLCIYCIQFTKLALLAKFPAICIRIYGM